MNVLLNWVGGFLMFLGFLGILFGLLLLRLKPQDLGRMYLSTTLMGGGEMSEGPVNRLLLACRGSERAHKTLALAVLLVGLALSLSGAVLG